MKTGRGRTQRFDEEDQEFSRIRYLKSCRMPLMNQERPRKLSDGLKKIGGRIVDSDLEEAELESGNFVKKRGSFQAEADEQKIESGKRK